MINIVDVQESKTLDDYNAYAHLTYAVQDLMRFAQEPAKRLNGRTVWMVNSTAQGGGVAEMMPKMVTLLRELGIDTEWAVISSEEEHFFELTKRIHNLIHGSGDPHFSRDDRELYASVSRTLAQGMKRRMGPDDILVVHDPQPLAMGAILSDEFGVPAIWRCHIGLDEETPATQAAWEFLRPWAEQYDRTVFSLEEYVPSFLSERSDIIHPAIDPLSHKNRELSIHKITGILKSASLSVSPQPSLTTSFPAPALRLQRDGSFAPATRPEALGLLVRPIVTQISRWDHLKGFAPLLKGFAQMKKRNRNGWHRDISDRHRRRLELVRLILAGPSPDSVQDDPEGEEVFRELCGLWHDLDPALQRDIAILALPMSSRKANALMVNVLQRCSSIVAQNSLREGFGLTVTEGMWKRTPILGSRAAGINEQVNDGEQGCLVANPDDPMDVATVLDEMLEAEEQREVWGRNAKLRASRRYLVFAQIHRWLEVLTQTLDRVALPANGQSSEGPSSRRDSSLVN